MGDDPERRGHDSDREPGGLPDGSGTERDPRALDDATIGRVLAYIGRDQSGEDRLIAHCAPVAPNQISYGPGTPCLAAWRVGPSGTVALSPRQFADELAAIARATGRIAPGGIFTFAAFTDGRGIYLTVYFEPLAGQGVRLVVGEDGSIATAEVLWMS